MVTIADVAQRAKVSKMTVSRVINDRGYVKEETRVRVQKAIDELHYRPNMVAKGLATRHSGIIAYMVADVSDPFYNLVSKGVENACFERDYTSIICDANSDGSLATYINMIIDRQIDGAIFHHHKITQQQVNKLLEAGISCVAIDNELDLDGICQIDSDNYGGGLMAIRHLVSQGHTKIGCIHGVMDDSQQQPDAVYPDTYQRKIWHERTRGYEDGMREAGIEYRRCYQGCGDTQNGYLMAQQAVKEMLKLDEDERPTALYCQTDALALGALSEALESGITMPGQLAIVGHDGLDMPMMLYPRITTIVQPRYQMGQISANLLIDAVLGRPGVSRMTLNLAMFQGDTT